jgi:hypothetical protein
MGRWNLLVPNGQFAYDSPAIQKHWARLHAGDQEALSEDPVLLQAWALFHNGQFEAAYRQGCKLGPMGATVANKAVCIYAAQLDAQTAERQTLCLAAAERAEAQLALEPGNANAHFLLASSLARYSQGISVAKGLAQGLSGRIKAALETAISLQARHADAHFALGSFHADIIDKVGELIGNMTFGAKRATGLQMFQQGFALQPHSAGGLVEYGTALLMLEGEARQQEAAALYARAARLKAMDAAEYLEVAVAKKGLPDGRKHCSQPFERLHRAGP